MNHPLDFPHRLFNTLQLHCKLASSKNLFYDDLWKEPFLLVDLLIITVSPGLARMKGMCSVGDSCTLNKDTGLGTAFTITHETGHK